MLFRILKSGLLLGLGGQAAFAADSVGSQHELASFREFRTLPQQVALQGQMVRIKGVVLCSDPAWGQLYIHDGAETRWFSPLCFKTQLRQGDQVEITGLTMLEAGAPGLTNLYLVVKGSGPLPKPTFLSIGQFAREFGQWVETRGEVRVAEASWGRLALVINADGHSCLVYVMGSPPTNDLKQWVGCKVQVRGINASKFENGRLKAAWLFAAGLEDVSVLERPSVNPAQVPVTSIDSLLNRELGSWTNSIVHVNGVVATYHPGASIEIKDPTGSITAHPVQINRTLQNERVDLWGFLTIQGNEPILADAYFETLHEELPSGGPLLNAEADAGGVGPVLRKASDVIALTKEKAATHIPVQLRGLVTFADPEWHNLFLHDESADVYVESSLPDVRAGQYVELTGRTDRGGFVPEVTAATIKVVGTNSLPAPAKVDLQDLANASLDAHWVELEGVVRRVSAEWGHVNLSVMTRYGRFRVIIPDFGTNPPPMQLIDALVSVQGACSSQMNSRGQLSGITLHAPTLEQIRVLESVAPDPFSTRAIPIASVATFDPVRLAGRRVKVTGVVTLLLPKRGFIMQDGTGGIRVGTSEPEQVHVGDAIEALGFPALDDFSPCLEEAAVRPTGVGRLPHAPWKTAEELLGDGTNDMQLVQVDAQLVQAVPRSARQKLMLQSGPIIFSADLQSSAVEKPIPAWQPGALVRLKGVCCMQGNEQREPEAFRLLLNQADDVVLLAAAPWWTLRHTIFLGGSLGLAVLVAGSWIFLLRHQVRAQTRTIHQNQKELLETSRRAGMAEVASAVLHNIGNVLTTVNIAAEIITQKVRRSTLQSLIKAVDLLQANRDNLGDFLDDDPKGKRLPEFLQAVSTQLQGENRELLTELKLLQHNIDHIKSIVIMQQSYARVSGLSERLRPQELFEDAIRMNLDSFERHGIQVVRDYAPNLPEITVEKHKVLQVLVNLLQNAKHACEESRLQEKQVTVSLCNGGQQVTFSVVDNGIGIASENLTRIFNHGFTTRKDGHGFGLHSGALTAREMGGALQAFSEGPGTGARFVLELPVSTGSK